MSAESSPFEQRKSSVKILKLVVMRSLPPTPEVPTFLQIDSASEGKNIIELVIEHCMKSWHLNQDYEVVMDLSFVRVMIFFKVKHHQIWLKY